MPHWSFLVELIIFIHKLWGVLLIANHLSSILCTVLIHRKNWYSRLKILLVTIRFSFSMYSHNNYSFVLEMLKEILSKTWSSEVCSLMLSKNICTTILKYDISQCYVGLPLVPTDLMLVYIFCSFPNIKHISYLIE